MIIKGQEANINKEKIAAEEEYTGKSFCYIVNKICNIEECDVYPCDGKLAFYNVPIKEVKD